MEDLRAKAELLSQKEKVDEGMGMSKVLSDMVFAKVTPGNYAVIDDVVVDISKKPNVEEQEPSLMEQISNRKPTI